MKISLPYGHENLEIEIDADRVLTSGFSRIEASAEGAELIEQALRNPIGSKPLHELAHGKKNAVILISDHTRPVPSKLILPRMLRELRRGSPEIDITLLVATGCHRSTTREELIGKLGSDIYEREKVVIHNAFNPDANVDLGFLPSGAQLSLNKKAVQTELLVAEGFIEPHFFAGFSGGRKSVLPGICAYKTVYGNHCGKFIADDHARTGILEGNPIHRDMEAAAEMANLQFILNVVLDEKKNVAAAFAGNFRKAHAEGIRFLESYCSVEPIPGDVIVVTNGGAPLDQNLYQCVKGLSTAEATAKENAVIILCAEMADGIGGDGFYRDMRECLSPAQLFEKFCQTKQDETLPDQWQTQILCRILMKHRVIFVTRKEMQKYVLEMKMEYAPDLQTALKMVGQGEITVIPDGVSVCIRK